MSSLRVMDPHESSCQCGLTIPVSPQPSVLTAKPTRRALFTVGGVDFRSHVGGRDYIEFYSVLSSPAAYNCPYWRGLTHYHPQLSPPHRTYSHKHLSFLHEDTTVSPALLPMAHHTDGPPVAIAWQAGEEYIGTLPRAHMPTFLTTDPSLPLHPQWASRSVISHPPAPAAPTDASPQVTYRGRFYIVTQPHTSCTDWPPSHAPELYQPGPTVGYRFDPLSLLLPPPPAPEGWPMWPGRDFGFGI